MGVNRSVNLVPKKIDEARVLAQRLVQFFERAIKSTLVGFPAFPGCGWVDDCAGDIFGSGTLFEAKAERFPSIPPPTNFNLWRFGLCWKNLWRH